METLRPCSPRPVSPSELPGLDINKNLVTISIEDPFSDECAIKPLKRRRRRSKFQFPSCVVASLYAFVTEVKNWASNAVGGRYSSLGIKGFSEGM
jgi:hypothetical protein